MGDFPTRGVGVTLGGVLFEDDFNGPAGSKPDPSVWEVKGGGEVFLDGNSRLVLRAVKESGVWRWPWIRANGGAPSYNKFAYSGPRYIECKARVAVGAGALSAPAWECAAPFCGVGLENDVVEQLGREPDSYHGTVHHWTGPNQGREDGGTIRTPKGGKLASSYRVYGSYVYPERIVYSLGGVQSLIVFASDVGVSDFTAYPVVMNAWLRMGGSWEGSVDPLLTAATMRIDYIRVWGLA